MMKAENEAADDVEWKNDDRYRDKQEQQKVEEEWNRSLIDPIDESKE